jgi:hypothetical protein
MGNSAREDNASVEIFKEKNKTEIQQTSNADRIL